MGYREFSGSLDGQGTTYVEFDGELDDAARRPLPAWTAPSKAGAGRGFVNPPAVEPPGLLDRAASMARDVLQAGEAATPVRGRGGVRGEFKPFVGGDERIEGAATVPDGITPDPLARPSDERPDELAQWQIDAEYLSRSPESQRQDQAARIHQGRIANAPRMGPGPAPRGVDMAANAVRNALDAGGSRTFAGQAVGKGTQLAGDLALSTIRIVPETLQLANDILQLGTGGLTQGFSRVMEATSNVIGEQQSTKLAREHADLMNIMRDPDAGPSEVAGFLLTHPEYSLNAALPSVGSMALGAGGGRLGAQFAKALAARRGAVGAEIAAAMDRGAAVGATAANAAMNAGSTFDQTRGDLSDKYLAAGIAGAGTAAAGKFFDGGAEAMLARRAVAASRPSAIAGTAIKEAGQEGFESMSQGIGQATGEGRPLDPDALAKQATLEGVLGGIVGGAAGVSLPVAGQEQTAEQLARAKGFLRPVERAQAIDRRVDDFAVEYGVLPKAIAAVKAEGARRSLAERVPYYKRAMAALAKHGLVSRQLDDAALTMLDESGEDAMGSDARGAFDRGATADAERFQGGGAAPLQERPISLANQRGSGGAQIAAPGVEVRSVPVSTPAVSTPVSIEQQLADRLAEQFGIGAEATDEDAAAAAAPDAAVSAGDDAALTQIDEAAHEAATSPTNERPEPTDAQKEAGNYKVGRVRIDGMNVSIENPKGSIRRSKADAAEPWQVEMPAHYGYIRGTNGADGDHVDLFIGDGGENGRYWVINQSQPDSRKFDEHKVVTGVDSAEAAVELYKRSFADGFGDKVFASVSGEFDADGIKAKLPEMSKARAVRGGATPSATPEPAPVLADASKPSPVSRRQGPLVETWTGTQKKGMLIHAAQSQMRDQQKRRPDLQWSIVPAPEFAEDRFKLEGRAPVAEFETGERITIDGESATVAKVAKAHIVAQTDAGKKRVVAFDSPTMEKIRAARKAAHATTMAEPRPEPEIADELDRRQAQVAADGTREAASDVEAQPAEGEAAAATAGQEEGGERAGLTLDAQTEADLKTKAARESRAKKSDTAEQKRLADKAKADAEAGEFTLTGSDREADVAAAGGQQDLLERAPIAASGGAVGNFGQALPPSRRQRRSMLDEALSADDIRAKPLSEIWPAAENDAIEDKFAAAVAHAAREEIPAKPRKGYKLDRWIDKVQTLRDMAQRIVSGEVSRERFMDKSRDYKLGGFISKVALLEAIDRSQWKRIGQVQEHPHAYTYVDGKQTPAPQVLVEIDDRARRFEGSGSLADHLEAINELLGTPISDKRMQFEIRTDRKGRYFINKKGDSEQRELMGFDSAEAARTAMRERYDDLLAAWEAVKERDNVTERDLRSDANRDRVGEDWRKGRDITGDEFDEQFGFVGGEFGKWVEQGKGDKERQWMLNRAYDALMDLSRIVGVPPRALSLNGSLGIAFGARGSGWASAHFEPDTLVINLTKTRGAGALAHEWFHALDNYFSRLRGGEVKTRTAADYRRQNFVTYKPEPLMVRKDGRSTAVSKTRLEEWRAANPNSPDLAADRWQPDPKHPQGVRPQVEERFAELVKALDAAPFTKRSRAIDHVKDSGEGYWSQVIERAARSFESYVIHKMMQQGHHNDYLANVTPLEKFRRDPSRYPYPTPAEIAPIAEAFDDLFGTIETREDGSGNVALYDLSRIGDRIMRMGYQRQDVERIQAARRLAALIQKLDEDKITEAQFELSVRVLAGQMDRAVTTKAANRLMSQRERGVDYVRERLLRARRQGDIDPDAVEFALWALDQNPALADNLGIGIRTPKEGSAAGDYNPAAEIVRLFNGKTHPDTAVHEIMHHAERMMPGDMQAAIRKEWAAALAKAIKKATPEQRAALERIPEALAGSKDAHQALVQAIGNGPLNYDEHYQLVNPSEFWAVNAARLLGRRFESDSVWGKVKAWLREMVDKVKGLVGMRSDAPLLRALDYVIAPENFGAQRGGRFESQQMLSDRKAVAAMGDVLPSRSAMRDTQANIRRGEAAMNRAILDKADQHRAMFRNGLGWVDFVWGDDKRGLQHVFAQRAAKDGMGRDEVTRMLTGRVVEAIARGSEIRRRELLGSVRAVVALGDQEVVLVRNAGSNTWLLNGWKVSPGANVPANDSTSATQAAADSSDGDSGAGDAGILAQLSRANPQLEINEKSPAAQWVDSTVRSDGIDPTSTRSVGDVLSLAQEIEARNAARDSAATSRGTGAGMSAADAEAAVAVIRSALPKAPPLIVLDDVRKAPAALARHLKRIGAENDVEAAYYAGSVYVFPQHIASMDRFMFVVGRHEIRHYGFDSMLGRRRGPVLLGIAMKNPALMAEAQQKLSEGKAANLIGGIEEALADMPVERIEALTGIDRFIAAVRQWLRELAASLREKGHNALAAAIEPEAWTDRDIAAFVRKAEDVSRVGGASKALGQVATSRAGVSSSREQRRQGLPNAVAEIHTARDTRALKAHPDYAAAKAGDMAAAVRLVRDLVPQTDIASAASRFGADALWVYPHAEEASGRNMIPAMLAARYAAETGGTVAEPIVQINRAFHTGADAMQRLIARPVFDGPVQPGRSYVLVDDVSTMGATLAELANHVRQGGGEVVGVVTLANAGRSPTMPALKQQIRVIESRYGQALRDDFQIDPAALTRDEAGYILGFRDADALRDRATAAKRERSERLRSKGVRQEGADPGLRLDAARQEPDSRDVTARYAADPDRNRLRVVDFAREQFAERHPGFLLRAVEAPGSRSDLRAARAFARRIAGHDAVFVRQDGERLFNGVAFGSPGSNYVLIDVDSPRPAMAVLGHEMLHRLRGARPDLYDALAARLSGVLRDEGVYRDRLLARYEELGLNPLPEDKIREELIADVFGDEWNDPQFWRAVAGEGQPGGLRAVLEQLVRILDDLLAKVARVRPFGTEQYLSDAQAARDAIAEATREFSRGEVGEMREPAGDIMLSVAPRGGQPAQQANLPLAPTRSLWANAPMENAPQIGQRAGGQFPGQAASSAGRERILPDGQPAAARLELPAESPARWLQRKTQDTLNRFNVVRHWAIEHGVDMTPDSNVWAFEERMHGRVATRVEDFREKRLKPLVKSIQAAGFTMDEVAEFLHAQHATERNRQIAKIDPQSTAGSGMTDEEAARILRSADPKLAELANEVRSITDDTRRILLDAGIISREMVDAWQATYQHYVPLKGDMQAKTGTGKGLSVTARQHRALGHGQREEHIVENILREHERAILLAEKNTVGHALLAFVSELSNDDIATVGKPIKRKALVHGTVYEVANESGSAVATFDSLEAANAYIRSRPGQDLTVHTVKADPHVAYLASSALADNEVQVYVKGHAIRVQLNDPLLANAYRAIGVERLNRLLALNREVNTWLSKAYTGLNPEFLLVNISRDFSTGVINIVANYGAGVAAKAVARYPKAFASVLRYSFGGEATPLLRAYRDAGGSTGAAYLSDLERVGLDVQNAYDDFQGVVATMKDGRPTDALAVASRKLLGAFAGWVEHLNAAGENAMRLAVFDALRSTSGYTVNDAASAAKNATVNFNRKGEWGQVLNSMYLFYNANVQGTAAMVDALAHGKHRGQAWTLLAMLPAAAYALAAAQFDDDEWRRIPDYVKSRNVIIRTGAKTYATLPIPYGYGWFWSLGNAAYDLRRGRDIDKVALNIANGLLENFSPVNPLGDDPDPRGLVELLPGAVGGELMRAAARLAVNRSGLGRDIVPDSKFDENRPDSLRMWRSTKGTFADKTAGTLNRWTGGTKTQSGAIDVSPETLRYWASTLTGGAGTFLSDTMGLAGLGLRYAATADAKEAAALTPELREIPVVRKFVRQDDIRDARAAYWSAVKEANDAVADFERARKADDVPGKAATREKANLLKPMVRMSRAMNKEIKARRDRVETIMSDDSVSLARKRIALRAVEAEEQRLYDKYVSAFDAKVRRLNAQKTAKTPALAPAE